MFNQYENMSSPAENWSWTSTGQVSTVPNHVGWPSYRWMPDGHISALKVSIGEYATHELQIFLEPREQ